MILNALKRLFGLAPEPNFAELVSQGAVILDVRTPQEFKSGHIAKSKNIAVQDLGNKLGKLPKNKIIITCCASGMRSAAAKSMLKSNGFQAYNGGAWMRLQSKI